jgi:meso-butanediol dehydrogenase/(S,S)-butanediol dehydrogenase/diacetyl reductase
MRLDGKVCVVTGGAQGIGRAIAARLLSDGAKVCIADINEAAAATAAEELSPIGDVFSVACDVAVRTSVSAMVRSAVTRYGRIDVVFNNAGIAQSKPFLDIVEADWDRLMKVNGLGVLICMQEAAQQMKAQGGGGKIVNTASVAGKQGFAYVAHYSASKFAVVALTQAGAREFAPLGITVNAFCPGIVATELWQNLDKEMLEWGKTQRVGQAMDEFSAAILLGRVSTPEDCAGIASFLASSDSDYMTGQSVQVDGGMVLQ